MPFRTFIKGRKTKMEAPVDIGVRSKSPGRICKDCIHYITTEKRCKFFRKIINPDWTYCSWYKERVSNNKEEK